MFIILRLLWNAEFFCDQRCRITAPQLSSKLTSQTRNRRSAILANVSTLESAQKKYTIEAFI